MSDNKIGSGTAAGLVEYLDVLIEKGRASYGAITPLKTSFIKVVEAVDGASWHQTDVNNIDVDDYTSRFANLTRGRYTDKSISVYKSRINRAIEWYKKFMAQPGWMPLIKPRTPGKSVETEQNLESINQTTSGGAEYAPARTLPSGIIIIFPNSMDSEVSFGGFGEELKKLDEKAQTFVRSGKNENEP